MKKKIINTLVFQIIICFLALEICLLLFTQISSAYVQRQEKINAASDALNQPYTQIYADLDRIDQELGGLGESTQAAYDRNAYTEVSGEIRRNILTLTELMCADDYTRDAVDLYYMIDSYLSHCDTALETYDQSSFSEFISKRTSLEGEEAHIRSLLADVGIEIDSRNALRTQESTALRNDFRKTLWIMAIVIAAIGITVVLYLLRRMILPIHRLIEDVEAFHLSDDSESTPVHVSARSSIEEVKLLEEAIHDMQIKTLKQHSIELNNEALKTELAAEQLQKLAVEKQLKETELMALQAQINPHFLFNTLNIISQMAYIEQAAQTSELLETFSELFRYNVDKFQKNVTLQDEIENVKGYIRLQQARFGKRITYTIEAESSLMDVRVPCLIIQPLVENSVSHGLRSKTEGGNVTIRVSYRGKGFAISVEDNGIGMEAEEVASLYRRVCGIDGETDREEHTSIGIANVYQRMKLIFGERLRFSVISEPNKGFTVILFIQSMEAIDELQDSDRR